MFISSKENVTIDFLHYCPCPTLIFQIKLIAILAVSFTHYDVFLLKLNIFHFSSVYNLAQKAIMCHYIHYRASMKRFVKQINMLLEMQVNLRIFEVLQKSIQSYSFNN